MKQILVRMLSCALALTLIFGNAVPAYAMQIDNTDNSIQRLSEENKLEKPSIWVEKDPYGGDFINLCYKNNAAASADISIYLVKKEAHENNSYNNCGLYVDYEIAAGEQSDRILASKLYEYSNIKESGTYYLVAYAHREEEYESGDGFETVCFKSDYVVAQNSNGEPYEIQVEKAVRDDRLEYHPGQENSKNGYLTEYSAEQYNFASADIVFWEDNDEGGRSGQYITRELQKANGFYYFDIDEYENYHLNHQGIWEISEARIGNLQISEDGALWEFIAAQNVVKSDVAYEEAKVSKPKVSIEKNENGEYLVHVTNTYENDVEMYVGKCDSPQNADSYIYADSAWVKAGESLSFSMKEFFSPNTEEGIFYITAYAEGQNGEIRSDYMIEEENPITVTDQEINDTITYRKSGNSKYLHFTDVSTDDYDWLELDFTQIYEDDEYRSFGNIIIKDNYFSFPVEEFYADEYSIDKLWMYQCNSTETGIQLTRKIVSSFTEGEQFAQKKPDAPIVELYEENGKVVGLKLTNNNRTNVSNEESYVQVYFEAENSASEPVLLWGEPLAYGESRVAYFDSISWRLFKKFENVRGELICRTDVYDFDDYEYLVSDYVKSDYKIEIEKADYAGENVHVYTNDTEYAKELLIPRAELPNGYIHGIVYYMLQEGKEEAELGFDSWEGKYIYCRDQEKHEDLPAAITKVRVMTSADYSDKLAKIIYTDIGKDHLIISTEPPKKPDAPTVELYEQNGRIVGLKVTNNNHTSVGDELDYVQVLLDVENDGEEPILIWQEKFEYGETRVVYFASSLMCDGLSTQFENAVGELVCRTGETDFGDYEYLFSDYVKSGYKIEIEKVDYTGEDVHIYANETDYAKELIIPSSELPIGCFNGFVHYTPQEGKKERVFGVDIWDGEYFYCRNDLEKHEEFSEAIIKIRVMMSPYYSDKLKKITYTDIGRDHLIISKGLPHEHYEDATVTVTKKATTSSAGKEKWVCSCGKTKTVTIPKIKSVTLSATTYSYSGSAKKPTVTVKDEKGKKLVSGTDYSVTYGDGRKKPGTYKVTVKFKGAYSGTVTKTFKITKKTITKSMISDIVSRTYTGKAQKPAVTVKNGSLTLKKDTDYTVSYKNNVKAGTATVSVTGKGAYYAGTATKTFKINKKNISKFKVSALDVQVYTGKKFTPAVTVKNGSKKLVKGTDYTVTYSNNVNPGTATVKITGKGNYTGTLKKTFVIAPKQPTITYLKSNAKGSLRVKWTKDSGATCYLIQYATNKKFGDFKTVSIDNYNDVDETIKGLKAGKTYYVRVFSGIELEDGSGIYGPFSSVKSVKVKK